MTKVKELGVQDCINMAKSFAVKSMKNMNRPILTTAYVSESYVYATDKCVVIKVKHNEDVETSYVHKYKELPMELFASSYPYQQLDRFFGYVNTTEQAINIDVDEWLKVHRIFAKLGKDVKLPLVVVTLNGKYVKMVYTNLEGENTEEVMELSEDTGIKVQYNCAYMLNVLRACKKLGLKKVKMSSSGTTQPLYFGSENKEIEFLVMPIRTVE